jgi:predicted ester cyclase
MTTEEIGRAFFHALDTSGPSAAAEWLAPTFQATGMGPEPLPRDAFVAMGAAFGAAFPGARHEMLTVIAEGDRVVFQGVYRGVQQGEFMGIPATGREIAVPFVVIHRTDGERIVEAQVNWDQLAMLQQLGAMPVPA